MRSRRRRVWPLAILGALAVVLAGFGWGGDAWARGGGRGGRGGGRGPRGPRGGGPGRGARRNDERKEEQARIRREERFARVAQARLEYAKRERQQLWDAEAAGRIQEAIRRLMGGATE